ncbi:MAG: quinone-dependent dihydroorotate dehydrogenase [Bacteroidota bacterium]|nr:quinone-dependent dihydroorotate dehydrogenase [Bacteroidota bacterium]
MYKNIIRPFLFKFQPEKAHNLTFSLLKLLGKMPGFSFIVEGLFAIRHKNLERKVFGLTFTNPVGLAAGLDKNAVLVDELSALGFGFIEVGTLTPKPQPGNPKPRMFRLPKDGALINRMGFNNNGVEEAVTRLKSRKSKVIIGGNIGKNKNTPNEEAYVDYEIAFEALFDVVDYFVVNVSSPNTPDLRALQEKEPLKKLLQGLMLKNKGKSKPKPILLKIAPDLIDSQLDDVVEIVLEIGIDGIIASNTTINKEGLHTNSEYIQQIGPGGLSGRPLRARATEVIKYLHKKMNGKIPIIAVGGIFSAEDAIEKLRAGASLVQIYTGFIYEGPALIKQINKAILEENL